METVYTIYHIPGVKVGCTKNLDKRIKDQGYVNYEVIELVSTREQASIRERYWQEALGYQVDKISYEQLYTTGMHNEQSSKKRKAAQLKSDRFRETRKLLVTVEAIQKRLETIKKSPTWKEVRKQAAAKRKLVVIQYSKQGMFIKEWESAKEAALALKVVQSAIVNCATGKSITSAGYKWQYKN